MKKIALLLFLATAGILTGNSASAQSTPVEIQRVPPAVHSTWQYWMVNVYYPQFNRLGVTTWYMDRGVFVSKTVFRISSTFVTLTMHYSPQGELLNAETDQ
jgi:hypothetical protein